MIHSFYGNVYSNDCPGCSRVEPQPECFDYLLDDGRMKVHQDYIAPIPGMLVIESIRHVRSLSDLTEQEKDSFYRALDMTRQALKSIGVAVATLIQEERSSHFHAWWFPFHNWMKEKSFGNGLGDIRFIIEYAKENLTSARDIEKVELATKGIKEFLARG